MQLQQPSLTVLPAIAFLLVASSAFAGQPAAHEHTAPSHAPHQHGIANINIALDGFALYIELQSPAANIVGFEHRATTPAEHRALDQALAGLRDPGRLFRPGERGECRLQRTTITSPLFDADDAHEGHAQTEHDHADHGHADIEAAYRYTCKQPKRLDRIDFPLFSTFPAIERVDIQYIIGNRQGAAELAPRNRMLVF